ncbi:amino acid transporter [Arthrobacter sp. Leaf141]|nr:amino acid transporter [Arthrobacter sp. Leaf141]
MRSSYSSEPVERRRLHGSLGTGAIVLMVLAAAAPLSVIGGQVPLGFMIGNGVGVPSMFVLAAAILLLFAVGFTHMTKFIRKTGAFFIYISFGLSKPLGLAAAYLSIFSYLCIEVGLVGYLGSAASQSIRSAGGPDIPWWFFALGALAVVAAVGLRNIDLSSKVLAVLLVAEIAIVLIIVLAVLVTGGDSGLSAAPFEPSHILSGSPSLGLMFALAAFLGFESTAIFRDEAKQPNKTIPRATYLAVIMVGLFYTLSSWALVVAWGPDNIVAMATQYPATLIMETASRYLGPVAVVIINVLIFTSVIAASLSFHNVVTRYLHSLASHGFLPRSISEVDNRHNSPRLASLITSGVALSAILLAGLLGLNGATQVLAWTSGMATFGVAFLMAVTALAVIVFFLRTRLDRNIWKTLIAPILGFVGLAISAYLIVSNFPLLVGDVGADGTPQFGFISVLLLLSLVPMPLFGLCQALWLRRKNKSLYAAITDVEDDAAQVKTPDQRRQA